MKPVLTQASYPQAHPNVYVSDIIHKVVIEVDEMGTEAAAATMVCGGLGSAARPLRPRVIVTLDRPFWFGITCENDPGWCFTGICTDP